ncbi:lytic transglycosylase domain-containing protein [bacterium]|nr:lytic transglycosylase domain-containing protein [bacterium]
MILGLPGVLARIEEIEGLLGSEPKAAPTTAGQAPGPDFAEALSNAAQTTTGSSAKASAYDGLIRQAAQKYGIEEKVIRAVIRAESDYNPRCVSRAGAQGLMQLMPENCRDYGVTDPFDPGQNIDAGVHQLKDMLSRFGQLDLALAAYNAGPGAVKRYGGVPPYRETQAYVRKILGWLAEG